MREFQRIFIAPKDYETLVDDETGKPLIDDFPDGMFVESLTNPAEILSIEPNTSIYFIKPETCIVKMAVIKDEEV